MHHHQVRKIVGDMYVSVDEDNEIRETYHKTYQAILDSLQTPQPRTAELMPKVYECMVRMNDEDIRKEYITQMEIILNDDPNVSERVKGIAEGMSRLLKTAILGGLQLATTAFSEGDTGLRAALHTPEEPPSHRARSQRLWCPF